MSASVDQLTEERAIARAIEELAKIEHSVGWQRVAKVAEVVAKHFLKGDLDRIDARTRAVRPPVRRLAMHPRCPLSKSRLDEILAAFEVFRSEPFIQKSLLSPSHVAAVARLDAESRRQLLKLAASDRLSVRELRQRARMLRKGGGERRGRPPSSCAQKATTRLENVELLMEEALALLANADSFNDLEPRITALLSGTADLVRQGQELIAERGSAALDDSRPQLRKVRRSAPLTLASA